LRVVKNLENLEKKKKKGDGVVVVVVVYCPT
jgi:hypothetical protein